MWGLIRILLGLIYIAIIGAFLNVTSGHKEIDPYVGPGVATDSRDLRVVRAGD